MEELISLYNAEIIKDVYAMKINSRVSDIIVYYESHDGEDHIMKIGANLVGYMYYNTYEQLDKQKIGSTN